MLEKLKMHEEEIKKEMQRATSSHYDAISFTFERSHDNTRNLEK